MKTFLDQKPIHSYADCRLSENKLELSWFITWGSGVGLCEIILMSQQTREDTESFVICFDKTCRDIVSRSCVSIVAGLINSDPIENIFLNKKVCIKVQIQTLNFLLIIFSYSYAQNDIILGQTAISRKCNKGTVNMFNKIKTYSKDIRKKKLLIILVSVVSWKFCLLCDFPIDCLDRSFVFMLFCLQLCLYF